MTPNVISTLDTGMDERSNFAPYLGPRFMRFGPFQVDQHRQEVTKNGSRLKLQGKVYQVLVALLDKPGDVVTREELRRRLWPADTHVNYDANVNTTVNKLRQALGDSTEKPLYIETIPRKGYCLVVPSEASDVPGAPLAPEAVPENAPIIAAAVLAKEPAAARSGFWIPLSVVGLILAGMLLGAGITITTLLIGHFAQATRWP
ncbi:MAG TPA: winged helix-turn-helix domain-containing protein [Candidatus Acidoferrum sp.]